MICESNYKNVRCLARPPLTRFSTNRVASLPTTAVVEGALGGERELTKGQLMEQLQALRKREQQAGVTLESEKQDIKRRIRSL